MNDRIENPGGGEWPNHSYLPRNELEEAFFDIEEALAPVFVNGIAGLVVGGITGAIAQGVANIVKYQDLTDVKNVEIKGVPVWAVAGAVGAVGTYADAVISSVRNHFQE